MAAPDLYQRWARRSCDAGVLDMVERLHACEEVGDRQTVFRARGHGSGGPEQWRVAEVIPDGVAGYWYVAVMTMAEVRSTVRPCLPDGIPIFLEHFGVWHARFEDVDVSESLLARAAGIARTDLDGESRLDQRYVYFLQAVDRRGPIKIGVAGSPVGRMAAIQRMSPIKLSIVGVIPHAGQVVETELHRRFAANRLHGEWFEPTRDLLAYIAEHAVWAGAL